jgi:hypothetical protein
MGFRRSRKHFPHLDPDDEIKMLPLQPSRFRVMSSILLEVAGTHAALLHFVGYAGEKEV